MLTVFSAVLIALAVHYAAILAAFAVGFFRVRRHAPTPSAESEDTLPFVSVVVPARDEAASMETCLVSILDNDYPEDRFEVIVVDDGSRDATASVVRDLQHRVNRTLVSAGTDDETGPARLHLLRIAPDEASGKESALARGIAQARGAILLTTDADCVVGPAWIRTMIACFGPSTAFVSGPVRYRDGRTLFERMQALEFLGLIAVGAGAIGIGRPNLCNSANVGYRRDVYERFNRLDPSRALVPGDDEVLIQRIAAETDWQVRFCPDPAALVTTAPVATPGQFFEQRRRWARSALQFPGLVLRFQIVLLYLFFVLLLGGLVASPFVPGLAPAVAAAFALKLLGETSLLGPACWHFGRMRLLAYFLPAQPLHVLYLVAAPAAGVLGATRWKGRTIA